jgi:hypothetical protein
VERAERAFLLYTLARAIHAHAKAFAVISGIMEHFEKV